MNKEIPMAYMGYMPALGDAVKAMKIEPAEVAVRIARKQAALIEINSLVRQGVETIGGPHPDTVRKVRELVEGLYVAAEGGKRLLALIDVPKPKGKP